MLSVGKWHTLVPKSPRKNLRWRLWLLRRAFKSERFARALRLACERDILLFVNAFVVQFNPNAIGDQKEVGPFLTWAAQDDGFRDILAAIEDRKDLVVEKSREMGASWMFLIVALWQLLFHRNKKILCISRSADAVDKTDDSDALFWKIDFMLDRLPSFLYPGGKRSAIRRTKMALVNPRYNSSITGQASTGKAGVGGRCTWMFADEFSQIDEAYEVLARTAHTTNCRMFNFTHVGPAGAAFELANRVDVRKLVLHWSMHPEKARGLYRFNEDTKQIEQLDEGYVYPADFKFIEDGAPFGGPYPNLRSPWYDEKCSGSTPRGIATDLDINPTAAMSQFFSAPLIHQLIYAYARPPIWEGDILYDLDTGEPSRLVERQGGPLKLWIMPDRDGHVPDAFYCLGADIATGTGATPSCLTIVNAETGQKVGAYVNATIDPKEFAALCVAVAWWFKGKDSEGALMAWEKQGPGEVFGLRVIALGYRNVYYRRDEGVIGQPTKATLSPGWYPGKSEKRALLTEYQDALKYRKFLNHDEAALRECLQFKYDKGTNCPVHAGAVAEEDPSGATVNHGDRVIADALAWKMTKQRDVLTTSKKRADEAPKMGSLQWRRELNAARKKRETAWR